MRSRCFTTMSSGLDPGKCKTNSVNRLKSRSASEECNAVYLVRFKKHYAFMSSF